MAAERRSRGEFIATGADLADSIGLDALSLSKVARAAGISTPGAYKHVADITDLRQAIAKQTLRDVTALIQDVAAGRSGVDALVAMALALLEWARRHPGRYAALQTAVDHDDEEYVSLSTELVTAITATLRAYRLTGGDAIDAVRMLRALLHGFIMIELANGFQINLDLADSFERAVRSLDSVYRAWGAA